MFLVSGYLPQRDRIGHGPLLAAAVGGHARCAAALLRAGAEVRGEHAMPLLRCAVVAEREASAAAAIAAMRISSTLAAVPAAGAVANVGTVMRLLAEGRAGEKGTGLGPAGRINAGGGGVAAAVRSSCCWRMKTVNMSLLGTVSSFGRRE